MYYFTYVETGKRKPLGGYHGEELLFLSDSYPSDWEYGRDDEKPGEIMRVCWTNFVKTGDPNASNLPHWPAYDPRRKEYFELGRSLGARPVAEQVQGLERIMNQIFAESSNGEPSSNLP